MVKRKIIDAIDYFRDNLKKSGLSKFKVVLFGSHGKRSASSASDIDLIVVSEGFRNRSIFERAQLTKDAEIETIKKYLVPLDIITLTPEEFELKKLIFGV